MVRKPIAVETFYPSNKNELIEEIESSFTSKFGFGKLDSYGNSIAVIVPHAGFIFSGPCVSHAYSSLKKEEKTFVLLGTYHGQKEIGVSISNEEWQTPLGKIEPDKDTIKKLEEEGFKINNEPHKFEHSIENQLPFLQYKFKNFKIVPILVSHKEKFDEMKKLAKVLSNIDATVIVSSDLTHYGYNYNFLPFQGKREEVRAQMYKLDKQVIGSIISLDTQKFVNESSKTTICGVGPISVLIEYAKIKKLKAKLIQYYTSGDVIGDYNNAVGYASIVFE